MPKCFAENTDVVRITRQGRRRFSETKAARLARKQLQLEEDQLSEESEELLYGPEIAD